MHPPPKFPIPRQPEPAFNLLKNHISTISPAPSTGTLDCKLAKMSDGGEIEIENSVVTDVLPKDVVKEVGNVKLFNKWDYDVEVRDISLTYVFDTWRYEAK
jgi:hypothetical protein